MSAYLIVKSDTSQIDSKDFDYWYENENLYEAKKKFIAKFGTLESEKAAFAKSQTINKEILSNLSGI